ncbi:splicing regulator SDE2 [Synchiropus splendidus]|uniref:splicing regulator SDE2 n=1 Tax=Synchiropus splendidus TaxID=270530 RepID=UPI00237D4D1D|nr:splicing regulator SDE2 [Synchiropus splendidus]
MEVFVCAAWSDFPGSKFSTVVFPLGSVVRNVLEHFVQPPRQQDFFVTRNGRLTDLQDPLQNGAIYHLEPRLCGGKGGFGSMLRALGAQIEKTTNREACRDLSGRRLRDVNHEKEMGDWLKKQAEREAEKDQRRLERLQKKLEEPKHQFSDAQYQQQCHDMSERLEDSVLKGLQASSSSQVKADNILGSKRPNLGQSKQPKNKKKKMGATYWSGVDLLSSDEEDEDEEDDDDEDDEAEAGPSTSSPDCGSSIGVKTVEPEKEVQSGASAAPSEASLETQADAGNHDDSPHTLPDDSAGENGDQVLEPQDNSSHSNEGQGQPDESNSESQQPDESNCDQGNGVPELPEDSNPSNGGACQADDITDSNIEVTPPADGDSKPKQPDGSVSNHGDGSTQAPQEAHEQVDLSSMSSAQQLESLGLEVLKAELMSRGLKCGGTLSERAARLFSVKDLKPEQIDPALLAKPSKTKRK